MGTHSKVEVVLNQYHACFSRGSCDTEPPGAAWLSRKKPVCCTALGLERKEPRAGAF